MKLKELKQLLKKGNDDDEVLLPQIIEKQVLVIPDLPTKIQTDASASSVKHSTNLGDIISSLLACKRFYDITGRKINFMQTIDMKAAYYQGATHETVDAMGNMVCINQRMFDMIKPLVESQPYIDRMERYLGQEVNLDFDVIRGKTFVNLPHGSIQAWLFYAFPDLACDINKTWITLPDKKNQIEEVTKDKVILNFTSRYRNSAVKLDYFFLKKYSSSLIFAGTEKEHWTFCNEWQLTIPRLEINDFLELAYAIRAAKFLLCNQSMMWNLSTAMGTPRLLEVCNFAQNCLPFYGDNNIGYFHQIGLEYHFRRMFENL